MNQQFYRIVEQICQRDPRYKNDAYEFIMEALSYTQRRFKRYRHVSGDQLLHGIKDLLLHKFGPMTMAVLSHWGIQRTEDFGHIVFNLVQNKLLRKTEEDSFESFRNAYSFEEVFQQSYRQQLARKISRLR